MMPEEKYLQAERDAVLEILYFACKPYFRGHAMTADEERETYLQAAKDRALVYLPHDPPQAFTSMLSDMSKHPLFENHAGNRIGVGFMLLPGWISNPVEVRRWIEGYR